MVPTWTGKHFSSKGILNRLERSEKFTQNTGKMKEIYPKYSKSDFLIEVYLLCPVSTER